MRIVKVAQPNDEANPWHIFIEEALKEEGALEKLYQGGYPKWVGKAIVQYMKDKNIPLDNVPEQYINLEL